MAVHNIDHTPTESAAGAASTGQSQARETLDLRLLVDQAIESKSSEHVYELAPALASVSDHTYQQHRDKIKTAFGRGVSVKRLDQERARARAAQSQADEDGRSHSGISKHTARLLASIADMPERKHLLYRKFLWTPSGIYKVAGSDVTGKIYDLWLCRFEMNRIVHVWEPSEQVDGLLSIDDKRYFVTLASGQSQQELEISRKDATASLKPEWPNKLYAVAQPDEANWKRLGQFFDEVSVHCARPILNHYTATGLLRAADGGLQFCVPHGGALTPSGRDETGMVQFPVEYRNSLDTMRYRFYSGEERDAVSDFRTWLSLRKVTTKKPGAGIALQGVYGMAPLSQLIPPPNIFIKGRSGSKKSTLVRLHMQASTDLYGHGSDNEWCTFNLRAGATTDFYIEQLSYYLAGMVLFVDDVLQVSQSGPAAHKALEQWSKLLGYALTQRGSGRGRPNRGLGGTAKNWYVRGPLVGTAEVLPRAQDRASTFARCAVIDLDGPDCLDTDLLTSLQSEENARAMNRAYTRYIQWLLKNTERARAQLTLYLGAWMKLAPSARMAEVYARLETGAWLITEYGREIGALTRAESQAHNERARADLIELATEQGALLDIEQGTPQALNPVEQFKRCFARALDDQKLCFVDEQPRISTKTVFDDPNNTSNSRVIVRRVPQPPQCLPEDFDSNRAGWKFSNAQGEYERNLAYIAGSLHKRGERGGTFPYTLKINSTEWDQVYRRIEEAAEKEGLLLPSARAILDTLIDARLAKKNINTPGKDGKRKYHLIDLAWYISPGEEDNAPGSASTERSPEDDSQPLVEGVDYVISESGEYVLL